ncbi:MAG TPA: hypothetical protein VK689_11635, partial [Armatimonadota bacterium]|nr:hypothetical protein [Armatimonadota bacterium]
MTAHPSSEVLDAFQQRTLPQVDLLEVGNHVARCDECSARVTEPAQVGDGVAAWARTLRSPLEREHLEEWEITGLLDGRLEPEQRKFVEAHVGACSLCAEDVQDLRAFREELRSAEPATSAAEVPPRRQLLPPWSWLRSPFAPGFAAGVALAAVLAVG